MPEYGHDARSPTARAPAARRCARWTTLTHRRRCVPPATPTTAPISYVDDRLGRLMEVLRLTGRLENTVVILTSDHGDMLGERGLWYKMSFFEGSVRVPLVVSAPGRFAPREFRHRSGRWTCCRGWSVAGGPTTGPSVGDLDGESLLPLCGGRTTAASCSSRSTWPRARSRRS